MVEEEPEYKCPECGAMFTEGATHCPECALVLDWTEEAEYECPDCSALVGPDMDLCPECGVQFIIEDEEPEEERPKTEDELLEEAVAETLVVPEPAPEKEPPEEEEEAPPEEMAASEEEAEEEAPPEEMAAPEEEGEEGPAAEAPAVAEALPPEAYPKLYPGGFSKLGVASISIAALSLVFTLVMIKYDTWIRGVATETVGQTQMFLIMLGLAAFAMSMLVSIYDLLRSHEPTE